MKTLLKLPQSCKPTTLKRRPQLPSQGRLMRTRSLSRNYLHRMAIYRTQRPQKKGRVLRVTGLQRAGWFIQNATFSIRNLHNLRQGANLFYPYLIRGPLDLVNRCPSLQSYAVHNHPLRGPWEVLGPYKDPIWEAVALLAA